MQYASRHIWVGSLRQGTTEEHLYNFFSQVGQLESVRISGRPHDMMVNGFLHFARTEDALECKERFHNMPLELPGLPRAIMNVHFQERGSHIPSNQLRLHNLSPHCTCLV